MKAREKGRGTRTYDATAGQDLSEALERLVQLYDATNRLDEAAKYRKELEALGKAAAPPVKPKDK
jgi:hypothetical protein